MTAILVKYANEGRQGHNSPYLRVMYRVAETIGPI